MVLNIPSTLSLSPCLYLSSAFARSFPQKSSKETKGTVQHSSQYALHSLSLPVSSAHLHIRIRALFLRIHALYSRRALHSLQTALYCFSIPYTHSRAFVQAKKALHSDKHALNFLSVPQAYSRSHLAPKEPYILSKAPFMFNHSLKRILVLSCPTLPLYLPLMRICKCEFVRSFFEFARCSHTRRALTSPQINPLFRLSQKCIGTLFPDILAQFLLQRALYSLKRILLFLSLLVF